MNSYLLYNFTLENIIFTELTNMDNMLYRSYDLVNITFKK